MKLRKREQLEKQLSMMLKDMLISQIALRLLDAMHAQWKPCFVYGFRKMRRPQAGSGGSLGHEAYARAMSFFLSETTGKSTPPRRYESVIMGEACSYHVEIITLQIIDAGA